MFDMSKGTNILFDRSFVTMRTSGLSTSIQQNKFATDEFNLLGPY